MRRVLLLSVPLAVTFSLLAAPVAYACHFGGALCDDPPEAQPFDPRPFVTIADDRTGANSDVTVGWRQDEHEQFTVRVESHAPAAFGSDLDAPNDNELIADVDIVAIIQGAQTEIDGDITDHNGHAGHPSGGVYHWLLVVHASTGDIEADVFADRNAGHLHISFAAPQDLIDAASAVDASVLEVEQKFVGKVHGVPFLTNPSAAGTYTFDATFTAWDDPGTPETPPTVDRSTTATIVDRVPQSVSVAPGTATVRTGSTHSLSATVRDQANEALEGASVSFSVAGANPASGSGTTGTNGQASFSYTGANAGDDTITVTATKSGTSATASASAHWIAPSSITLTPGTMTRRTGETHTLTATVRDQDGNPMTGETVSFTRTGANPGSGSATTGAGGTVTHSYTGSNDGTDTITAGVAAITAQASATWYTPIPTTLTLTPASANRNVGQAHTLTAELKDQQGRALENTTVSFQVTGANPGSGARTTDATGRTTFSYTGTSAGDDTVTATAGSATATATVRWDSRTPTTLTFSLTHSNAPFAFAYRGRSTATATVTIRDQNGALLPDVTVRFRIVSGPNATGQFDRDIATDANGQAVFRYTGTIPNGEGTDTVRATVPGTSLSGQGTVRWHIHPCDDPNGTHGNSPIGGHEDTHSQVQGQETWVHVCNNG